MRHPWEAERPVPKALAQALIEAQFPPLAPAVVEPFAAGWDNAVFRVNDTYIFRFPKRRVAVPLMRRERRALPQLAPQLPLPVPEPTFLGQPCEDYDWPFAGYRMLPGHPAYTAGLDEAARLRCAKPLARFLRALHRIPLEVARRSQLPYDSLSRLEMEKRLPMGLETLSELVDQGQVKDPEPIAAALRKHAVTYTASAHTVVHGDLHVRNVLVDEGGGLSGVIDWGDVHLGDAAVDLALAQSFLPPHGHELFRKAYGPIPEAVWRAAAFRALYISLVLLSYGHGIQDRLQVKEAQTALGFLVGAS